MIHMDVWQIERMDQKHGNNIAKEIMECINESDSTQDNIDVMCTFQESPAEGEQNMWSVWLIHDVWQPETNKYERLYRSMRVREKDVELFVGPACTHLAERTQSIIYIRVNMGINTMTSWDDKGGKPSTFFDVHNIPANPCIRQEQKLKDMHKECPYRLDLSSGRLMDLFNLRKKIAVDLMHQLVRMADARSMCYEIILKYNPLTQSWTGILNRHAPAYAANTHEFLGFQEIPEEAIDVTYQDKDFKLVYPDEKLESIKREDKHLVISYIKP